jgi:hypothetical protein
MVVEYVPTTQLTQLVDTEVPVDVRYDPTGHVVHAEAPAATWNWPATQFMQLAWLVIPWYWPAAQFMQLGCPVEACDWPGEQLLQLICPEPDWNNPAEQLKQLAEPEAGWY